METRTIQEFLALAELGSSYMAAEKLFVSQSSLLRHIQALEEEFGAPLFDRTRRGFSLNANGAIFLPYAEKIAMAQAQCYDALHRECGESNVIRLSAEGKIIDLLIDFKREYPQYNIDYQKVPNLEDQLNKGNLEIAFLSKPPTLGEKVISIPFNKEEVLVLLYDSHPFAERESVSLEELRSERFIALCEDMVFDTAFLEMFKKVGFVQDISATVPVGNDLTRMVSEGLGIALIHGRMETTPSHPGLKTIPLNPRMEYEINMCYRSEVPLSKAAERFVTFAKKWKVFHKNVNLTLLD